MVCVHSLLGAPVRFNVGRNNVVTLTSTRRWFSISSRAPIGIVETSAGAELSALRLVSRLAGRLQSMITQDTE